ncbi:hypothetical protein ACJJTC_009083 [Scirpophaga incertulas]
MDCREYGMGAAGPQFCPFSGSDSARGERWKIWLRNFNYYIDGQVGLSDKQKIARLLHQAGTEVQEIYETLSKTVVEGRTEYEKCNCVPKTRARSSTVPTRNTGFPSLCRANMCPRLVQE